MMTTRNSNARFELAPQVEIERSTFDRSTSIKTSFNVGELIPFYVDEVLPGDTFEIKTSKVARLQTLITPIMDNLYLDTYYFFVPNRLVWEHWKEFCGENTQSAWIPSVTYSIPQITEPSGGWATGTIADYFGLPVGRTGSSDRWSFNALPFRAYALICNEWFRDENLEMPLVILKGDATVVGVNTDTYYTDVAKGGAPYPACKYHDYFTSCLPAPQKGPDVNFYDGVIPVYTYGFVPLDNTFPNASQITPLSWLKNNSDFDPVDTAGNIQVNGSNKTYKSTAASGTVDTNIFPANLWADMSLASGQTINNLRQAFQIQRLFEKDARSGTRYIEVLEAHFSVKSPDARLQRPEYLGGNRVPFNIEQVVQNSSTDSTSPQGNVAGWSQTNDFSDDVHKSFVEHGYIIGLMCARYDHSYQQGIEPMWSRTDRFDFYWPALAHLGEKAVLKKEIYAYDTKANGNKVFGYQEAWAEYKYKPNYVTGQMRSQYAQSLDIWHFADNYVSMPSLTSGWIQEDKRPVDRTLAVPSTTSNQIFIDILVSNKCTRPMPLYSIPGLIDHF